MSCADNSGAPDLGRGRLRPGFLFPGSRQSIPQLAAVSGTDRDAIAFTERASAVLKTSTVRTKTVDGADEEDSKGIHFCHLAAGVSAFVASTFAVIERGRPGNKFTTPRKQVHDRRKSWTRIELNQ